MRAVVIAAVSTAAKAKQLFGRLNSPSLSTTRNYSIMTTTTVANSGRPYRHQLISAPWSTNQVRSFRAVGGCMRRGQVFERKDLLTKLFPHFYGRSGRLYQVVISLPSHQLNESAIISVTSIDIDSGNKVHEKFRPDEPVGVFVDPKSFTYLHIDEETDSVVLMEPKTSVQVRVPKQLFGESLACLEDGATVSLGLFNGGATHAIVSKLVTCTVVESQVSMNGMAESQVSMNDMLDTPHSKNVLLDDGLTVEVPPDIVTGDKIIIDTTVNAYVSRAWDHMD